MSCYTLSAFDAYPKSKQMEKTKTILSCLMFVAMAFFVGCNKSGAIADTPNQFVANTQFATAGPAESVSMPAPHATAKVYVCKSTGAKKYHFNESCRGLKQCTHEVVTMTVKEAEGKGLGLCGWED